MSHNDDLAAAEYFAGKPWFPAFMWMNPFAQTSIQIKHQQTLRVLVPQEENVCYCITKTAQKQPEERQDASDRNGTCQSMNQGGIRFFFLLAVTGFSGSRSIHMNARIQGFPPCIIAYVVLEPRSMTFTSPVSGLNVVADECFLWFVSIILCLTSH